MVLKILIILSLFSFFLSLLERNNLDFLTGLRHGENVILILIRRFGSDRIPHQWYLLKSRKYKKDGFANFTFFSGITWVLDI